MKSFILASTLAALCVPVAAPVFAAGSAPVLTLDAHQQIDRRGRNGGVDSPRDKAQRPGKTHP